MLRRHHRWRLKSLCFARFTSRPWVSFLCNKQGFLNQEMDATRIARGISVIKDPCFTHTHRRASQSSDGILPFCQRMPGTDLSSAKSFCFFWYCGGVKALASQIVNQLEAVFCAKYILAPKSMYPPLGNS